VSDILSIVAITVSVLTLIWTICWSVYTHRRQQREQEERRKEKVRATPKIDGGMFLVDLYNESDFPLHIKSVQLTLSQDSETAKAFSMIASQRFRMPVAGPQTSKEITAGSRDSLDLPPRTTETFEFPATLPKTVLQDASRMSPDKLWVAISTHAGEIARVDGSHVLPLFQTLAGC
jgi:hypothetical protein